MARANKGGALHLYLRQRTAPRDPQAMRQAVDKPRDEAVARTSCVHYVRRLHRPSTGRNVTCGCTVLLYVHRARVEPTVSTKDVLRVDPPGYDGCTKLNSSRMNATRLPVS